jgi:hypothetical protein
MRCNRKTSSFAVTPIREKDFSLNITEILQLRRNKIPLSILRQETDNSDFFLADKIILATFKLETSNFKLTCIFVCLISSKI